MGGAWTMKRSSLDNEWVELGQEVGGAWTKNEVELIYKMS